VGEFELIERWFRPLGGARADVRLGIGDDAALLLPEPGAELVATVDTLVEGRHFLTGADPRSLGHRALAVSLSDLAAMGATPCWALLALTLPEADAVWLTAFARGFGELAQRHGVALVGGNTARGPLNICVQLFGNVPQGSALLRSGARAGDAVYVTGTPGDAAAGREPGQRSAVLRERCEFPVPRVAAGQALRGIASACIDVSDGLAADLDKLAKASGLEARLQPLLLPLSDALLRFAGAQRAVEFALTGGEDYELCFTVPLARQPRLAAALPPELCRMTRIGSVESGRGPLVAAAQGFDHFGS
jgi:thiamine-monophosphate kinase